MLGCFGECEIGPDSAQVLTRIHAVQQEAAERTEPSDGLRLDRRGPPRRLLDGERMGFVPILEKLTPSLCFLCFLLFFTA